MCVTWVIHALAVRFDSHVLIANIFGVLAQLVALWIHLALRNREPLHASEINLNDGTWSSWFLVRVEGYRTPPFVPGSSPRQDREDQRRAVHLLNDEVHVTEVQ